MAGTPEALATRLGCSDPEASFCVVRGRCRLSASRPIWFGLATAQPDSLDLSTVPVVAVAGRNRLSVRPRLADSRHRGAARFAVLPSRPLIAPKCSERTWCVAASWLRPVWKGIACWTGASTRSCLPQTLLFPVRLLLRTPDILSVCDPSLRLSRGCQEESQPDFPWSAQVRIGKALRSSAFPLPGT